MDWSSEKSIRDHLTAKKVELAILRLLASRKSRIFYLQVETVEKVDSGMAEVGPYTTVTVVPSLSYSTEKSSYLDTGYLDTYIYRAWQL